MICPPSGPNRPVFAFDPLPRRDIMPQFNVLSTERSLAMFARCVLYLCFAAVAGFLSRTLPAQDQPAPKPLKIGVVDLRVLMDSCQMRKDKEAEINKRKDAEAAKLKEERKQLDGVKSELDLMPKDNPQFFEKSKEFSRKQEAFLLKNRWAEADVLELWEKTFLTVYTDILHQIESFRQKNDYDIILRYDSQPLGGAGTRVIDQLDRKVIMARAASVDVTDALIQFVNDAYAKEKKQ